MKPKQVRFLQALFTEGNVAKASESVGISKATAYRYLNDPDFKKEIEEHQSECLNSALRYLQGQLSNCTQILMEIINDPLTKDQVKINAIQLVFNQCKSMTETSELLALLPQIEQMTTWIEKEGG